MKTNLTSADFSINQTTEDSISGKTSLLKNFFLALKQENREKALSIFSKITLEEEIPTDEIISATDEFRFTLLHWTAWLGIESISRYLIEKGADINNSNNNYNLTPLYGAKLALAQHTAMVDLLMKNGVDESLAVDERELISEKSSARISFYGKNSARNSFSEKGSARTSPRLENLRKCKKNIETIMYNLTEDISPEKYGLTEFYLAVLKGDTANAKILLARGADVNFLYNYSSKDDGEGLTPIYWARLFQKRCAAVVDLLRSRSNEIDQFVIPNQNALIFLANIATRKGHIEKVKILTEEKQFNFNAIEETTGLPFLHWATLGNYKDMVKSFLDNGADINAIDKNGLTPLDHALLKGNISMIYFLKTKQADPKITSGIPQETIASYIEDESGLPFLHWLANEDNKPLVANLISNGTNVNALDENGLTPLDHAVLNNNESMKELLKKNYGAKAKITSSISRGVINSYLSYCVSTDDVPFLHWATLIGYRDLVQNLIDKEVNVNAIDKKGLTPLDCAVLKANASIKKLLIANGAKAKVTRHIDQEAIESYLLSESKLPFLHWAARRGRESLTQDLINNGANINALDAEGLTPINHAIIKDNSSMIALLKKNRADVNIAENILGQIITSDLDQIFNSDSETKYDDFLGLLKTKLSLFEVQKHLPIEILTFLHIIISQKDSNFRKNGFGEQIVKILEEKESNPGKKEEKQEQFVNLEELINLKNTLETEISTKLYNRAFEIMKERNAEVLTYMEEQGIESADTFSEAFLQKGEFLAIAAIFLLVKNTTITDHLRIPKTENKNDNKGYIKSFLSGNEYEKSIIAEVITEFFSKKVRNPIVQLENTGFPIESEHREDEKEGNEEEEKRLIVIRQKPLSIQQHTISQIVPEVPGSEPSTIRGQTRGLIGNGSNCCTLM